MTIAFKVIGLHEQLSANDKRVAVAIIEHFNRRTEQCDPSADRLMDLLAVNRHTVFRAIKKLHDADLIVRDQHGGKSHRNAYRPNWGKFRDLDAAWSARFAGQAELSLGTSQNCDGEQSQNCDGDSRRIATQTISTNQNKKTISRPQQVEGATDEAVSRGSQAEPRDDSLSRNGQGRSGQRYLIHALSGGRGEVVETRSNSVPVFARQPTTIQSSRSAAAKGRAEARLDAAMRGLGASAYTELVGTIDPDGVRYQDAVAAEQRRHGSGLAVLLGREVA